MNRRSWAPQTLFDSRPASLAFVIVVVAAWLAITAFVSAHHEPWRDEADQWLYVRDCDLATMLERLRYNGHPALWYLVLAPLPRLAFPYGSQKVLHLLIAGCAVALFAARAPLSRLTKTLAIFSYFFLYEYSVIVRDYAIAVLLAFAVAATFRRRDERPFALALLLFLLFNSNAQGFVVAAAFSAVFVIERVQRRSFDARSVAAACLIAIGALLSWFQVRTPPDPARQGVPHLRFDPASLIASISSAFLPTLPVAIGVVAALAVVILVAIAISSSRPALAFLLFAFGGLTLLYAYIWYGGYRHAGFFLIVTIVAVWIAVPTTAERFAPPAAVALNVVLAASLIVGFAISAVDVRYAFSGSREMAGVIARNGLDRYEIAAHNLTQTEALLPYLDRKKFWYAGLGRYGTYMTWDRAMERGLDVPYPAAEARARRHFAGKPWLLLFNVEMPDPAAHGFRLLYANREIVFENRDERYWLYAPLDWPGPPIGVIR